MATRRFALRFLLLSSLWHLSLAAVTCGKCQIAGCAITDKSVFSRKVDRYTREAECYNINFFKVNEKKRNKFCRYLADGNADFCLNLVGPAVEAFYTLAQVNKQVKAVAISPFGRIITTLRGWKNSGNRKVTSTMRNKLPNQIARPIRKARVAVRNVKRNLNDLTLRSKETRKLFKKHCVQGAGSDDRLTKALCGKATKIAGKNLSKWLFQHYDKALADVLKEFEENIVPNLDRMILDWNKDLSVTLAPYNGEIDLMIGTLEDFIEAFDPKFLAKQWQGFLCENPEILRGEAYKQCDQKCNPDAYPPERLCSDGVECTVDQCELDEPGDGCTHTPQDSFCADNEICDAWAGCIPRDQVLYMYVLGTRLEQSGLHRYNQDLNVADFIGPIGSDKWGLLCYSANDNLLYIWQLVAHDPKRYSITELSPDTAALSVPISAEVLGYTFTAGLACRPEVGDVYTYGANYVTLASEFVSIDKGSSSASALQFQVPVLSGTMAMAFSSLKDIWAWEASLGMYEFDLDAGTTDGPLEPIASNLYGASFRPGTNDLYLRDCTNGVRDFASGCACEESDIVAVYVDTRTRRTYPTNFTSIYSFAWASSSTAPQSGTTALTSTSSTIP